MKGLSVTYICQTHFPNIEKLLYQRICWLRGCQVELGMGVGNQLRRERFPVVQFLGAVSLLVCRSHLSVRALVLRSVCVSEEENSGAGYGH